MNDVYIELKEIAIQNNVSLLHSEEISQVDDIMPEFHQQSNEIKILIEQIKQNNISIKKLIMVKNSSNQKQKEANLQLLQILSENEKINIAIKTKLQHLNQALEEAELNEPDQPETLSKKLLKNALCKDLIETLQATQMIQQKYQKKINKKISRQIELVGIEVNQAEKKEIIMDPTKFNEILAQKTLGKTASLELQYYCDDISERSKQIKELGESVQRVHQLFQDIAFLVYNQGEQIDSIALNLEKAHDYLEKAEKVLIDEKKEQVSRRKRMCCIVLIGVIILLLIGAPSILAAMGKI